jgi:hypothetical protein
MRENESKARYWARVKDTPEGKAKVRDREHRRIFFKGRRIVLPFHPRIGRCEDCGATGVRTDRHHLIYDEAHPFAFTRELCVKCHRRADAAQRRQKTVLAHGLRDFRVGGTTPFPGPIESFPARQDMAQRTPGLILERTAASVGARRVS